MELIVTTSEELESIIQNAVNRALNFKPVQPQQPDTCDLPEACEHLHQLGYKIPKSAVYKLSCNDEIPCRRIGRRLMFSRAELHDWLSDQLEKKPRYNAALELSKSAQKKLRRG